MKHSKVQLIDWRKVAIGALVGIFTLVPIVHVATFTGSFEPAGFEWLGYVYALGLDFGIAVCAWFTRWDTTRQSAWVSYFVLVLTDGGLNVAHVKPWNHTNKFAWLYAIFPTLIVGLLSILARQVGALSAKGRKVGIGDAITNAIGARLGALETQEPTQPAQEAPQPTPQPSQEPAHSGNGAAHGCPYCDMKFTKSQSVSAHLRFCDAYKAHQAQEAQL